MQHTVKTQKFENWKEITVANLKFRPIIDQTIIFTCNAANHWNAENADYLRPLCKNQHSISDTPKFPQTLSSISSFQDDEDVSYDVESLFTNICR